LVTRLRAAANNPPAVCSPNYPIIMAPLSEIIKAAEMINTTLQEAVEEAI